MDLLHVAIISNSMELNEMKGIFYAYFQDETKTDGKSP